MEMDQLLCMLHKNVPVGVYSHYGGKFISIVNMHKKERKLTLTKHPEICQSKFLMDFWRVKDI